MKTSTIALGLLCAAVLCGRVSAAEIDYGVGTRALPLLQAGGTARAMAMGSAVVAVPEGSGSLLWNPAALSRMECSEVGLHHNAGLGDTIQELAIFGKPLGPVDEERGGGSRGGIAASVGYVSYGSLNGRDATGVPTSNYGNTEDFSGSVGYGREMLPGISGGVVLKENHANIANKSYDAFTADVGILMALLPNVDLGLVYSNLNLGNSVGGSQPTKGWRAGTAWTVDKRWILSASGELQDEAMSRLQFGTEFLIGNVQNKSNVLALRAGYQLNYPDPELTGLTGLTFGLGYTIGRSFTVDYAMLPAGELGTSHRLSLTFKFACPKK